MYALGFEYIWSFSKEILSMFQIFSASNFSVNIFPVYCAIQWNQYEKFIFYMVAPAVGLFLIWAIFIVRCILLYITKHLL